MPALAEISQVDSSTVRHDDNKMLGDQAPSDLRKRIRRDNRVWLLAFFAVLVASGFVIWTMGKQDEAAERRRSLESATQRRSPFPGEAQSRAAEAIRGRLIEIGIHSAWVRFVDRDQVEVELPASVDREVIPRVRNITRLLTLEIVQREPIISIYIALSPGLGRRTGIELP